MLLSYTSAKKFSDLKAFWTRVLTPCLLMELENWRFDRINDEHAVLVKDVLDRLEMVVELREPDIDIADVSLQIPLPKILSYTKS